jgi:hypothetical protein
MDFYKAKGIMETLLTGDIARESLEIADDEYLGGNIPEEVESCQNSKIARDIPPGEDIKWVCGDCMATDWTPISRRCPSCI